MKFKSGNAEGLIILRFSIDHNKNNQNQRLHGRRSLPAQVRGACGVRGACVPPAENNVDARGPGVGHRRDG